MNRTLLLISVILISFTAKAQHIYDGGPNDSTGFTFEITDSLRHYIPGHDTDIIDTTNTHLWRIGKTHKSFFVSGGVDTTYAIMTDTSNHYPLNANDWFVLKTHLASNLIIDFSHKYQTLPHHSGGIVEFSLDTGNTWQNVLGGCNADSTGSPGIHTDNFYTKADTLQDGEFAFTGLTPSMKYSRLQFFWGLPARRTGGAGCDFGSSNWGKLIYIRFRFVSDTLLSPFDGWLIDDMKIEADSFTGAVPTIGSYHALDIYPNPAKDGIFVFPALNDEKSAEIEVYDMMGEKLFKGPYVHRIDLSGYPKGLYLYKVVNSSEYYSGRLVIP